MYLESSEIVAINFRNSIWKVRNVADGKNIETDELLSLTLYILASVCILSILFSIHLL